MLLKRSLLSFLILLIMLIVPVSAQHFESNPGVESYRRAVRIQCASTTSTQNSGFFDYILPIFEKKTGIRIDVIAVGTGAAIEIGKRGDADVVFVHARDKLSIKNLYNNTVFLNPGIPDKKEILN